MLPGTESVFRSRLDAFRSELKRLGHVDGRDLVIEARWGENKLERLPALAADVVALKPAVILTASSGGIVACKKATTDIPFVFATASSPVEQGFVASLRRPGGNVTGVLLHSGMAAKMVEIAREAMPRARRFAILIHETDPVHKLQLEEFTEATRRFALEPLVIRVARSEELAIGLNEAVTQKADMLYLPALAFTLSNYRYVVDRSLKDGLPVLSSYAEITAAGGLLSYGTGREENFIRAAALVDKILRGAKPGDLPVEQPDRFELIVNMKTAKLTGVAVSHTTLLRANKVIE
jgi:putative tryptophan/tyrosine transport system substrate-binding protein